MYNEYVIEIQNLTKKFLLFKNKKDKLHYTLRLGKLPFVKEKKYKEFYALKDIEIKIQKGERIGIIGKNGSGKSTLLKIIAGRFNKTSGNIEINGIVNALMELGTGFHPDFTGRENIYSSLSHHGYTQKEIKIFEEEIIDFAEIEEFIDQPVKVYSAGMYTRLAFAIATTIKPDILIVDEVLGAGDSYFLGKSVERMKSLTIESGATVLFVSHDLSSVQMLSNRVVWIHKGQIKMDGSPLDVIKAYSSMIRKEEDIRLKARDLKISKKQAISLEKYDDIYEKMLFRFVTHESTSKKNSKIYFISLKINNEIIGTIDVGAAMDNNTEIDAYILDDSEYMNWGSIQSDKHGTFREYKTNFGKYNHAPFEFSIPRTIWAENKKIQINCILDNCEDTLQLEYFDTQKNSYVNLGLLPQGYEETNFLLNLEDKLAVNPMLEKKKNDIDDYGNKEIKIESVDIIDSNGRETKTLVAGKSFKVIISFNTKNIVHNPTFVFCIYDISGITISQWIISTNDIGVNEIRNNGIVEFFSDKLIIGKGSYVASVGIFKQKPEGKAETPAYHVWNRSVHFQVIEPDNISNIDYGRCLQPYRVAIK